MDAQKLLLDALREIEMHPECPESIAGICAEAIKRGSARAHYPKDDPLSPVDRARLETY